MSAEKTYHILLQKLREGTITDNERWQLERASLDDPFLADALEGYYSVEKQERIDSTPAPPPNTGAKSLTLSWLSIAASLLVLVTASLWFVNQRPEPKAHIAESAPVRKSKSIQHQPSVALESSNESITAARIELDEQEETSAPTQVTPKKVYDTPANGFKKEADPIKRQKAEKESYTQANTKSNADDNVHSADKPQKISEAEIVEQTGSSPIVLYDSDIVVADESVGLEHSTAIPESRPDNNVKTEPVGVSKSRSNRETESLDDMAHTTMEIEKIPMIFQGKVTDHKGNPLAGVELLSRDRIAVGTTNDAGIFNVPNNNAYVIAAFAGYDSATVALQPQVSIALQPSSELLSKRHMSLAEMMDDNGLIAFYKDRLNQQFSDAWPLCHGQDRIRSFSLNNVNVHIRIDEQGNIYDLTYMDEVNDDCKMRIETLLSEQTFEKNRPVNFLFRINI